MLLVAAVALLFAAGPGGAPSPGLWETNGPAYPAIDLIVPAPDDENVVYAGAHDPETGKSALFRSRDGGTSWETVAEAPAGETLTRFAIDPTGPEHILALTKSTDGHGQMYRSDDGGRSWRLVLAYAASDGAQVFFDPAHVNVAYFFSNGRLRRSEGDGAWTHVQFQSPLERVWISSGGILFWSAFIHTTVPYPHPWLVSYWAIFRSATQGLTSFEVSAASCPDLDSVFFAPSDPQVAYAASSACTPLSKSVDGGAHWNSFRSDDLTNLLGGLFGDVERIAIDPTDATDLFATLGSTVAPYGLLVQSENGGRNWSPIPVPATPIGPLAISPSGRFLYIGTDAGVYRLSLTGTRALPPRD
jgi:hypothetical protein